MIDRHSFSTMLQLFVWNSLSLSLSLSLFFFFPFDCLPVAPLLQSCSATATPEVCSGQARPSCRSGYVVSPPPTPARHGAGLAGQGVEGAPHALGRPHEVKGARRVRREGGGGLGAGAGQVLSLTLTFSTAASGPDTWCLRFHASTHAFLSAAQTVPHIHVHSMLTCLFVSSIPTHSTQLGAGGETVQRVYFVLGNLAFLFSEI